MTKRDTNIGKHSSDDKQDWDSIDWEAMSQGEFCDTLFEKLEAEPALLSCDEMDDIEKWWRSDMPTRRMALVFLTKPWKEVQQQIIEDDSFAAAAGEVVQCLDSERYKALAEVIDTAGWRIKMALCSREDGLELAGVSK